MAIKDMDLGKSRILEIELFMVRELAILLEIDSSRIEKNIPFEQYGIDSMEIVQLSGRLSEFTGHDVHPEIFYDFNTIEKAATYIANI